MLKYASQPVDHFGAHPWVSFVSEQAEQRLFPEQAGSMTGPRTEGFFECLLNALRIEI
jgi:hypothetical protein